MDPKTTQLSKLRRFVDRLPLDPKSPRQFGLLGFLEASFVPMPIEVITAPFMIAYPKYAVKMAWAMWIGCITASVLFYSLGFLLFEPVVQPALAALGLEQSFNKIQDQFTMNGLFWTVVTMALLPMPLQFATLGAGLMHGNIIVLLIAVATSRGVRYFGLALLARFVGPHLETILTNRRFGALLGVATVVVVALLIWFVALPTLSVG